jgi:hypothetical protein
MKPEYDWSRETHAEIGQTLLRYGGGPLTASQLERATGRKNAKRTADEMVAARLLERDAPQPREGRARGRPPSAEYRLVSDAVDALRNELARSNPPGVLNQGQHVVFAEAGGSQIASLFEVLASSEAIARASWFALLDGEPQELAVAFGGDGDALGGALDLMAELRGARLAARRSVVVGLGSSESLVIRSARASRAARRARLGRATREG